MTKRIYLFFFFFVCFSVIASANYEFNSRLAKANSKILSLHFDEASQLLKQEEIEKPGNDLRFLFLNRIDFLKTFITEDKAEFERLKKNSSIYLDKLKSTKENISSPFHLYIQAEININLAFTSIKFQEYVTAANDIRRAYKLIERNESLFPNFILNKKVSGLLHVVVGSVPSKYQWAVKLVGLEGNISQGAEDLIGLYKALENSSYSTFRPEILFYLGNVNSILSSPVDSIPFEHDMKLVSADNPLISYIYANILMKVGRNDEAFEIIDSALKSRDTYPFAFLYYKRGIARLRKSDLDAEQDFLFFISHHRGENNIKAAYQKIAWTYLLRGDTTNYFRNMKICAEKGKGMLDEDKAALEENQRAEIPNIYLLRARLYFDGGYYQRALSEIVDKKISDFPHYHDQLEVTYRLGRIMQQTGKIEKAIDYYELTLKNGLSSLYYFAANSALMLGLIYEDRKQYEKAETYYKKCISIEHIQYKNSIDQKAQAGLNRIKDKL